MGTPSGWGKVSWYRNDWLCTSFILAAEAPANAWAESSWTKALVVTIMLSLTKAPMGSALTMAFL